MKWVASILLIANVVIFLRVGDRQLDPGLQAAPVKPDINKDSMLLLHEVNPQAADAGALRIIEEEDGLEIAVLDSRENITVQADGQNEVVKSAESASASNDGSTEAEYVVAAEVALARSRDEIKWSCYRIGPFRDAAEWQLAQQWANSGSISFEPVRSESRELRAVRIYVGPFPTIADTRTDVALLKQKGLDHFVYMRDDNQARISSAILLRKSWRSNLWSIWSARVWRQNPSLNTGHSGHLTGWICKLIASAGRKCYQANGALRVLK